MARRINAFRKFPTGKTIRSQERRSNTKCIEELRAALKNDTEVEKQKKRAKTC